MIPTEQELNKEYIADMQEIYKTFYIDFIEWLRVITYQNASLNFLEAKRKALFQS
jgi:hypothetical protein